jgi:hypothetical protein
VLVTLITQAPEQVVCWHLVVNTALTHPPTPFHQTQALPQESVVLRHLLCAAGDITTSDVDLAAASGGMVVGFNLTPDENVLAHAKMSGEAAVLESRQLKWRLRLKTATAPVGCKCLVQGLKHYSRCYFAAPRHATPNDATM